MTDGYETYSEKLRRQEVIRGLSFQKESQRGSVMLSGISAGYLLLCHFPFRECPTGISMYEHILFISKGSKAHGNDNMPPCSTRSFSRAMFPLSDTAFFKPYKCPCQPCPSCIRVATRHSQYFVSLWDHSVTYTSPPTSTH